MLKLTNDSQTFSLCVEPILAIRLLVVIKTTACSCDTYVLKFQPAPHLLTVTRTIAVVSFDGSWMKDFMDAQIPEVYKEVKFAAVKLWVTGTTPLAFMLLSTLEVHHKYWAKVALYSKMKSFIPQT